MISINSIKNLKTPYLNVDFGWYVNNARANKYQYTLDNENYYPPGLTTVTNISGSVGNYNVGASTVTTFQPTGDAAYTDFDVGGGVGMIVNGNNWCLMQYSTRSGNIFEGCKLYNAQGTPLSPSLFPAGSQIWDPRFYIYAAPLNEPITFDCADTHNFGLPTVAYNGITPAEYVWDFGNGTTSYGDVDNTTAEVTYSYNQAPPTVQVTLNVIDNLGQEHTGFHHLILLPQDVYS